MGIMNVSSIDRKYLISPKILYLLISLQFYSLHQFRGPFAREVFDVSKSELGQMLGVIMFLNFFTNIFIATLNDRFDRPKLLLVFLIICSSIVFQLFFFEPYAKAAGTSVFWFNMFLFLMFNTSMQPLLDKITLEYLSKIPNVGSKTYGKQRMWGTIGYLLANLIIELSIKSKGSQKTYNFDNLKYYQLITTVCATIACLLFITSQSRSGEVSRNEIQSSWKDLLTNKPYMFFIFIILLNGITRAGMTFYLAIYQKEVLELKGYNLPSSWPTPLIFFINLFNGSPLATTAFFAVILEIVILYNSQRINSRFGLFWPLLMAQIAQLIRFIAYYFVPFDHPNIFLYCCSFELLKGINFGLIHSSGVQLATLLCPPHLKTTSQMIYSGAFTGLASALSGVIFGRVFAEGKMSDKNLTSEEKLPAFLMFFFVNIIITIISIALFIYKYGYLDRVLTLQPFIRGGEIPEIEKKEGSKVVSNFEDSVKEENK